MRKRMIGIWTAVLAILALLAACLPVVESIREARGRMEAVQQVREELEALGDEAVSRHRNLAKWYNLNLNMAAPEPGSRETYEEIWAFRDGAMGYMEIPAIGMSLPVYHGTMEETLGKGAGHMAWSPLPAGGRGNHTVLQLEKGFMSRLLKLQPGDLLYLSIPGGNLVYAVESVQTIVQPGTVDYLAPTGEDVISLTAENGLQKRVVRCLRLGELQEREVLSSVTEVPRVDRRLLAAAIAAAICVGMLPLAAGCLCRQLKRLLSEKSSCRSR